MSSPTLSFGKLSLGTTMPPTTRSQAQSSFTADYSDSDDDDDDDEIVTSPYTKLKYNVRGLSPDTEERARDALAGTFALGQCSFNNSTSLSDQYFIFQVLETVSFSVRIGTPSSQYRKMACRCDQPKGCSHMLWLLDQITARVLTEGQKQSPLTLQKQGFVSEIRDPYSEIIRGGPRLFEKLGKQLEIHEPTEEPEILSGLNEKITVQSVRDMMAYLSRVTSDEYRPDIFSNTAMLQDLTKENMIVEHDLEQTLARALLINYCGIFRGFRSLVTSRLCGIDFFQKKEAEARRTIELLRIYASRTQPPSPQVHDITWCAEKLISIVDSIRNRIHGIQGPMDSSERESAAIALTTILSLVIDLDENIYDNPVWNTTQEQTFPLERKNLFYRLIISKTRVPRVFVLDELWDVQDMISSCLPELDHILQKFDAEIESKKHRLKLRDMLSKHSRTAESHASGSISRDPRPRESDDSGREGEASGSGVKRSQRSGRMPESEVEPKRVKHGEEVLGPRAPSGSGKSASSARKGARK